MDGSQFDAFARILAAPVTRRGALRRLAAGGLATGFAAAAAPHAAFAQGATPASPTAGTQTCVLPFEAAVRRGPDAGLALDGLLALAIGPTGAVDHGVLMRPDGTQAAVVGQVTGRAVNLLFTLADGRAIYGVGTASADLRAACEALMATHLYGPGPVLGGPLVGPKGDDAGDWLTCCCPTSSNNYDCGSKPLCGTCAPKPSDNYLDESCVDGCRNTGESLSYCSQFCTLQP